MLDRLLAVVDGRTTVHLGELANELHVTEAVVRHMLADLTVRGFLKPSGGSCTTECGGCAFATACHGDALSASWQLTDRGRARLAARSTTAER